MQHRVYLCYSLRLFKHYVAYHISNFSFHRHRLIEAEDIYSAAV